MRRFVGLLALAALSVCLAAFAAPYSHQRIAPAVQPDTAARSATIRLARTACYGTCPVYTVEIHGDGRVIYLGQEHVAVTGRRTARVAPQKVAALVRQFRAADFFRLKDAYQAGMTDMPTNIVSLTLRGRTKTVVDYRGDLAGMPRSVSALEAAIDRLACTDRWVLAKGAGDTCR